MNEKVRNIAPEHADERLKALPIARSASNAASCALKVCVMLTVLAHQAFMGRTNSGEARVIDARIGELALHKITPVGTSVEIDVQHFGGHEGGHL